MPVSHLIELAYATGGVASLLWHAVFLRRNREKVDRLVREIQRELPFPARPSKSCSCS